MKEFNIFSELKKNLEDFNTNRVIIAVPKKPLETARFLNRRDSGYTHSARETIAAIQLAINSVFATGKYDSEGQRKVFLNIVNFYRDVTRMRTDIDTKNYVFRPEGQGWIWWVYFLSQRFRQWVKEKKYAQLINSLGDDFCTYGWAVSKKVKNEVERTPIRNLFFKQDDSKGLDHTARNGGYCGEVHKVFVSGMKDYGWDTEGLDESKEYTVYEQYSMIPRQAVELYKAGKGSEVKVSDTDRVLAMQIIILDDEVKDKASANGNVLFIERVTKTPYNEARFEDVDGRTMPRGPVESQLENQIARNLTANARRRGILHSTKRIYQSQGDEFQKNLVKDVRDGTVLSVGMNGLISSIPNETRNLAELSADDNTWKENSQQRAFAFEAATGENMPSGTPFRLGVILSNAVESYFRLKKQVFGLFLKESFFDQILPIFIKEDTKESLTLTLGSDGIEHLKQEMTDHHINARVMNAIFSGKPVDLDAIKQQVGAEISKSPYLFIEDIKKGYKQIKYSTDLDITDEANDTAADIESWTNVYTSMVQQGDPRAEQVLNFIFALRGKNFASIAGPKPATPATPPGAPGQGGNAALPPGAQNAANNINAKANAITAK